MEALKKKILAEGEVYEGNILKVDCFLNHQIDFPFMKEVGREFHRLYKDAGVNKILTIEASGIGIACLAAPAFDHVPVVFAKKNKTKNIDGNVYLSQVESFTQGKRPYPIFVSKEFLHPGERVLLIDDIHTTGATLSECVRVLRDNGADSVLCLTAARTPKREKKGKNSQIASCNQGKAHV